MEPTQSPQEVEVPVDQAAHAPQNGIAMSAAQFDLLRQARFRYLLFYGCMFLAFAAPRGLMLYGIEVSQATFLATVVVMAGFHIAFYYNFYRALRMSGYGIILTIAFCALVLFPVPGFIILILFDRSLGKRLEKAWDAYEARMAPQGESTPLREDT